MNPERFLEALETVLIEERNREGIGRLAEKTVHATLKLYFEPDRSCHEVKVGSLVADVKNERDIIEIQTGSFTPLRRKLEAFLPDHAVRVVYPMAYTRRIVWIEKDGTLSAPHKSPVKRQVSRAFAELICILPYLTHENFTFHIVLMDLDEYRLLSKNGGKGRGTERYERMPTALREEIVCRKPEDYLALLPDSLPEEFDAKTFSKVTRLKGHALSGALKVLLTLGLYTREREGREAYIYKRSL